MLTRRTFIKTGLVTLAGLGLAGCAETEQVLESAEVAAETEIAEIAETAAAEALTAEAVGASVLVAYYSAQGHTEAVANTVIETLGAGSFVITPAEPYTSDDLNYNNDDSRVCIEHNDANRNVELVQTTPEGFENYDVVLVGYPIWWGDAAWVVDNFVKGNDFTGKTVIPFCTSASSPLGDSGQLLAEMAGTGDWQEGMRFSSSVSSSDVTNWANGLGL